MRFILLELLASLMLVLAPGLARAEVKPEVIDLSDDAVETRGMSCSLQVKEVETGRPIPMLCKVDYAVAGVELRYRNEGAEEKWERIELQKASGGYTGTIPCNVTFDAGELQIYVFARNEKNKVVGRVGRFNAPIKVQLVERSSVAPPALPGKPAPQRCYAEGQCPEAKLGTSACPGTTAPPKPAKATATKAAKPAKGTKPAPDEKVAAAEPVKVVEKPPAPPKPAKKAWGQTCNLTSECQVTLECVAGSCETPAKCESAADCAAGGECNEGLCHVPDAEELATRLGPPKHHWIGLHAGADIYMMSEAAGVCGNRTSDSKNFACFEGGGTYAGLPNITADGHVSSGVHLATVRALVSYDYVVGRLAFGGRLGWAFRGAPKGFSPLHIEARALYGLKKDILDKRFRPYLGLALGHAPVDAASAVSIVDCTANSQTERQNCANEPNPAGVQDYLAQGPTVAVKRNLNAYHAGSPFFFGPTVMLVYALSNESALVFNLTTMLPDVNFEPTVGYAFGL